MTFVAEPITVLLVDDHFLVREGLRTVLSEEADIHIVGEAGTAAQGCRMVESLRPRIILLDLTLPDGNGLELIPRFQQLSPESDIIVLTIHDSELYMAEALGGGASAYLLKDSPPHLIPLAIRSVVDSGCLLDYRMLRRLLRSLPVVQRQASEAGGAYVRTLSQRELDILKLISEGHSNREIGEKMHLAEATVKKYVHSLKAKLSVNDRAQAAVMGLRLGLVD